MLPAVLPSVLYSLALAQYFKEVGDGVTPAAVTNAPSRCATATLVQALLLHPQCLGLILEACAITADTVGAGSAVAVGGASAGHCVWKTVLSHPHFAVLDDDVRTSSCAVASVCMIVH